MFEVNKTIEEINEKIKRGEAVVVNAEEMIDIVEREGFVGAARKVDVVTTGTFGTMCSSGALLNFGHTSPKIKASKVWLNDVEAYGAIAAVDCYLGATAVKEGDPLNAVHPGRFEYGGGHVIEDLIARRPIKLVAEGYTTDCYPAKHIEMEITIDDLRQATLMSPRNAYQNYSVAVNSTAKTVYTYMGVLKPNFANATYSSAGQLSPLLNDPFYLTIGIGTRIFLGGGIGYVIYHGTQHNPDEERNRRGVPKTGAGAIAVMGDMKGMSPEFVRGASILGYGVSLSIGIGIPIPILNEEMAFFTSVRDEEIDAYIFDYGHDYPLKIDNNYGLTNYKQLKSGFITVNGKKVPASPLSSYSGAMKVAETLKQWIMDKRFYLTKPSVNLPTSKDYEPLKYLRQYEKGL
ncbi:homocysteine biosynthesis protein [Hippea sp. KM1]|uniref:homocysteine biosynthesis protein n=1 Tax=Hippea sp. KM1 TaxID=944481 RepID=UPI00046CB1EE|nr:homocysteine biosynthesis protein [Hippea sp. KM1]